MKYIKWFILFAMVTLTTGCWNYRELSDVGIVSAISIDIEDDEYLVGVDIINTKKATGINQSGGTASDEAPTTLYKTKAKTIKQAMNEIVLEAPYELYNGHIKLLLIGEQAAKKGIYDYIDYFMADIEVRKIFPVVVVENGRALDALKIILPLKIVTAEHLQMTLETESIAGSILSNRKFDEVINSLYMEGRHLTISSVKIIGSPEEGENTDNITSTPLDNSIKITGSAIFKKDKLIGYLYELDSLGYTVMRNLARTMEIHFPCDDKGNYGSVTVDNVKGKIKATIKDDKPTFEIMVKGQAAIPEYNCKIDFKKPKETIKEVEKMVNDEIKKIINNTMKKLQKELKSDVVGFGERLYKEHNKYWQKVKSDWDETFTTVEYKIKSDIIIESVASTNKPAKEVK